MSARPRGRLGLHRLENRDTPAATFFDLSYGGNGIAVLPIHLYVIAATAALPDGSVLVAGTTSNSLQAADIGVVKQTPAGQPDPAFGTNGVVTVAFDLAGPGQGDDIPTALAVRPDGRVVVAGYAQTQAGTSGGPTQAVAFQLTAAGQLDPTFDGDGKLVFPTSTAAGASSVSELAALSGGSTLLVIGATAVRLTPAGALDPGYGTGGMTTLTGTGLQDTAIDPAGRVLAVRLNGSPPPASGGSTYAVTVTRLTPAGQPDAGYGNGGQADAGTLVTNGGIREFSAGVVALADGSALVARDTETGSIRVRQSVVSRLDPGGQPDPSFGDGGTTQAVEGTTVRQRAAGGLVGRPTGGLSSPPATVVGLTAAGDLDTHFGVNGVIDTTTAPAGLSLGGLTNPTPAAVGTAVYALSTNPVDANRRENGVVRLVPAGNEPPTLAGLPTTAAVPAGGSVSVPLTVADPDSPAADLVVTAAADDTGLFPAGSLVVTGSGASRTLTATPAFGRAGSATVTVTVRDADGGATPATFTVDVRPLATVLGGIKTFAAGPGAGGGPTAGLFDSAGTPLLTTSVFTAGFTGGVRVAAADLTGDGVADLVVGTGPGSATRVEVYDGATRQRLFAVDPFEPAFTGGVFVAAGDLTGDGRADLIISPDEGGGPRVRVFDGNGFAQLADFFGIADPAFRGGARTAIGDVTGDGRADLLVAAGFGGGPRVAAFDGTSLAGGAYTRKPFGDFFAFEATLRNGVYLAAGDVDGDGIAEVVAGGGPGGGPRVSAFSGVGLLRGEQTRVADFFAGDPADRSGVRVAVKDLDGDSQADVVAGTAQRVVGYPGRSLAGGTTPTFTIDPFPDAPGGVFVG